MPKINKPEIYTPDTTLSRNDNWVGTDAQDFKRTKTFYAGDVLDYIMENYGGTEQNNFVIEKALGVIDESVDDALIDAINGLDAYTVSANQLALFTGEFLSNDLNQKFVYILQAGKGTYGVDGTALALTDIVLLNPVQPEVERNSSIINTLTQEDKIHSGRFFWTGTDLVFEHTPFVFTIGGTTMLTGFSYPPTPNLVTLDDPDVGETNPRIDLTTLDSRTGGLVVVKGTPSVTPQEPTLEFGYQLRVTAIYVPITGDPQVIVEEDDTPTTITTGQIYDENLGTPNEWDVTEDLGDIVFNDSSDPQNGTIAIKVPATVSDSLGLIKFTPSAPLVYALSDTIIFQLRSEERWINRSRINITITDVNGDTSSISLSYNSIKQYGYNSDYNTWQVVAIPVSDFTYSVVPIDISSIEFVASYTPDMYYDDIKYQGGVISQTFESVDKRIVDNTVVTSYNLDHSLASDWKLTMTGDTTFTESNLPTSVNTREFTIKMTGSFTPTFPAYWDVFGDGYDGASWNFIAVQIHDGNSGTEEVTVFITNMV